MKSRSCSRETLPPRDLRFERPEANFSFHDLRPFFVRQSVRGSAYSAPRSNSSSAIAFWEQINFHVAGFMVFAGVLELTAAGCREKILYHFCLTFGFVIIKPLASTYPSRFFCIAALIYQVCNPIEMQTYFFVTSLFFFATIIVLKMRPAIIVNGSFFCHFWLGDKMVYRIFEYISRSNDTLNADYKCKIWINLDLVSKLYLRETRIGSDKIYDCFSDISNFIVREKFLGLLLCFDWLPRAPLLCIINKLLKFIY